MTPIKAKNITIFFITVLSSSILKFYKYSYKNKQIQKFKKNSNYRIIGMGGSSLGARAIYDFLKNKINKNFKFIDNLNAYNFKNTKKKYTNLVISKSGNTTETIVNANILIKKKEKNIFITEKKKKLLISFSSKIKIRYHSSQ